MRVLLGKSPIPLGGFGFQACDHHPEHRGVREEAGGGEGATNHDVTAGRFFRSSLVPEQGFPVAGASRQPQGSTECGLSRSESQAHLSPGRLRSTLRRRDARVDRGATEGSPSGDSGRATPRGGEDLPTLVYGSAGVAADHPRAVVSNAICSREHGEVIRVRCGMAGVRVGRLQTLVLCFQFVAADDGSVLTRQMWGSRRKNI